MKRIWVSFDQGDEAWLNAAAAREGTAATELVRRAVRLLRAREPLERQSFDELLLRTQGLWHDEYPERLRDEW
jgi:hypothetical protein